jgi:hypothetical protein
LQLKTLPKLQFKTLANFQLNQLKTLSPRDPSSSLQQRT